MPGFNGTLLLKGTQMGNMNAFLLEYLPIIIFIGIAAVIGIALVVVPLIIAPFNPDPEKVSTYEWKKGALEWE